MVKKYTRVLIVDDSLFMRKALRGMLTSDPDVLVIGEAKTVERPSKKQSSLPPT